jgi:hypothetical protein
MSKGGISVSQTSLVFIEVVYLIKGYIYEIWNKTGPPPPPIKKRKKKRFAYEKLFVCA